MGLKFKKDAEPQASSDFWYDISDGGYIDPHDFLEEESAAKVVAAVELLMEFRDQLEARELLEEM